MEHNLKLGTKKQLDKICMKKYSKDFSTLWTEMREKENASQGQ